MAEFLFLNKHDGAFQDFSFVTGDGFQDIYITHLDFELNRLYHNNHDGTFTDDTFHSAHR